MTLRFLILSICVFGILCADSDKKINEQPIPITEDLMREHGLLNRVLLIYEEVIKRIDKKDFPADILLKAHAAWSQNNMTLALAGKKDAFTYNMAGILPKGDNA